MNLSEDQRLPQCGGGSRTCPVGLTALVEGG